MEAIEATLQSALPDLVELRHQLHQWPEPGYEEERTARTVAERLSALPGLEVRTGFAKTGVVGLLNGDSDGPCIALRADMDCLPMEDTTGLPWASQRPGFAHACGHDGHTTCLLGTAGVLAQHRDQLPGPVLFLFQPAEEGGAGAHAMIEDGALDNPRPKAIFGLHGYPGLEVGSFSVRPGSIMAASDVLRVRVTGNGTHAAMPHLGRDPILAASHAVTALQSLTSRRTDPLDSAVVTVAKFQAGNAFNVIPESVDLLGTIRTLQESTRRQIHEEAKTLFQSVCGGLGCRAEVTIEDGYPVCVNDARAVEYLHSVFQSPLNTGARLHSQNPMMAAEDFAFYGRDLPSTFFFVGVRRPGEENPALLHQNHYDFNDEAIPYAVRAFCALALNFATFG